MYDLIVVGAGPSGLMAARKIPHFVGIFISEKNTKSYQNIQPMRAHQI